MYSLQSHLNNKFAFQSKEEIEEEEEKNGICIIFIKYISNH